MYGKCAGGTAGTDPNDDVSRVPSRATSNDFRATCSGKVHDSKARVRRGFRSFRAPCATFSTKFFISRAQHKGRRGESPRSMQRHNRNGHTAPRTRATMCPESRVVQPPTISVQPAPERCTIRKPASDAVSEAFVHPVQPQRSISSLSPHNKEGEGKIPPPQPLQLIFARSVQKVRLPRSLWILSFPTTNFGSPRSKRPRDSFVFRAVPLGFPSWRALRRYP